MKPTTTLPSLALLALFALAPARAQVPSILNYQGRVTVGGTNLTTNAALFKFALVDSNGSTVYWRNDGSTAAGEPSSAVSVAVAQGLYSTLLGNTSLANMAAIPAAVFSNADVNLRVWFSAGGTNPFLQVAPDQRLGASGYALRAAVADNIASTNIDGNFAVTGTLTVGQLISGNGNTASGDGATVGGGDQNTASTYYATVGGGFDNTASSYAATVGGGVNNTASGDGATVGGGDRNTASDVLATVGGGQANTAGGRFATVGGGLNNTASDHATVSGGVNNTASGSFATVGGGSENTATQRYATVPGGARAFATNSGAFVWSGDSSEDTGSFGNNTFTVRAEGGVRFYSANGTGTGVSLAAGSGTWTSLSDRNAKENFEQVDGTAILAKVAAMPVMTWNYKTQKAGIRHIGPMAQDFKKAFGIGETDTGITTVDADGVALAAIQGLIEELKARDKTIEELKAKSAEFESKAAEMDALKSEMRALRDQVQSALPPAP
jgi:hypothetical protein